MMLPMSDFAAGTQLLNPINRVDRLASPPLSRPVFERRESLCVLGNERVRSGVS